MFDLIVIGAGPAGYVAALYGARKGMKVAVVEKDQVGGVCLNRGCIPSKALIASGETYERILRAKEFGIDLDGRASPNLPAIVQRKERVVELMRKGVESLFKGSQVTLLRGDARVLAPGLIEVNGEQVEAKRLLVATGSSPSTLPGFPLSGRRVLSTDHILSLTDLPKRLLVLGAGAAGCEMGFFFSMLGVQVTLVELMPRALPGEDEDISRLLEREMRRRKIQFLPGVKVEGMEEGSDGVKLFLPQGKVLEGDYLFVSIGRLLHSRGLGLEELGVRLGGKGEIETDGRMRTNVTGIYAAGDVIGGLLLAHVASAEGKVAVDEMLGQATPINYEKAPWAIFTSPEIGRVGLTEREALARLGEVRVGRFPYRALGKAQAIGETAGEAKIVASASGEILGAHIIGAGASDLVQEVSTLMQAGATLNGLRQAVFSHPTLSEAVMEAFEDLEGLSLHQLSPTKGS
ncbi:MAG: dihydrolipoyl dehydrogenase [Coprothermobacterota bacterium]|nr:dihydrolipoyl dehydrogenase [Coprothermobacterota bacterium]